MTVLTLWLGTYLYLRRKGEIGMAEHESEFILGISLVQMCNVVMILLGCRLQIGLKSRPPSRRRHDGFFRIIKSNNYKTCRRVIALILVVSYCILSRHMLYIRIDNQRQTKKDWREDIPGSV
ncbi:hypothetical protein M434DRAFT_360554 [Hypoxylon sp. CO27-5]|nr:hypothetical protein M434DRAFT_360554 [Hypoxylon sp. CO27-5]